MAKYKQERQNTTANMLQFVLNRDAFATFLYIGGNVRPRYFSWLLNVLEKPFGSLFTRS